MRVNRQQMITVIIAMLNDIRQIGPERFDDLFTYRVELEKGSLKSKTLTKLVHWYSIQHEILPFPEEHLDLVRESLDRFMNDRANGSVPQKLFDMVPEKDGPLLNDESIQAMINTFSEPEPSQ